MKKLVKSLLTVGKIASLLLAILLFGILAFSFIRLIVELAKNELGNDTLINWLNSNLINLIFVFLMAFASIMATITLKRLNKFTCKKDTLVYAVLLIVSLGFAFSNCVAGICLLFMKDKYFAQTKTNEQPAK